MPSSRSSGPSPKADPETLERLDLLPRGSVGARRCLSEFMRQP